MCGIAGAVQLAREPSSRDLKTVVAKMTGRLVHRGPDGYGIWSDSEAGVCLGHRRLAVVDLSEHGKQPMSSATGGLQITFNGEIYNFRELGRELEKRGHKFTSTGDTQVLLAAIVEWGLRPAVQRLNGMFAFAVWDSEARVLHLVRDRMGEKPLHFAIFDRVLYFASEARALRVIPGFSAEICPHSISSFLRFGYVPEPYSIYEKVKNLSAGTILSIPARRDVTPTWGVREWNSGSHVGGAEVAPVRYWSCADAAAAGRGNLIVDAREATIQCEDLLRDVVRHQMLCDVPIGCFLSGGIDSTLVAAVMQSESHSPIHTFTVDFVNAEFDESHYARSISSYLGTRHEEFQLDGDAVARGVPNSVSLMDEPTANGSFFAAYEISKLARSRATVVLSGDGGDELFAGYNRHVLTPRIWSILRRLPASTKRRLRDMLARTAVAHSSGEQGVKAALMPIGRQVSIDSILEKLDRLLYAGDFRECYDLVTSCWPVISELACFGHRDRIWSDLPALPAMLLSDQMDYLPGDNLAKLDRASMAASLETRLPLLDHRLVEFSWRVPDNLKLRRGHSKWLLRSVLNRMVPKSLTDRRKMGFTAPVDDWMRGSLREWAHDSISDPAFELSMGPFYPEVLSAWATYRQRGTPSAYQVWALVILGAWLRDSQADCYY